MTDHRCPRPRSQERGSAVRKMIVASAVASRIEFPQSRNESSTRSSAWYSDRRSLPLTSSHCARYSAKRRRNSSEARLRSSVRPDPDPSPGTIGRLQRSLQQLESEFDGLTQKRGQDLRRLDEIGGDGVDGPRTVGQRSLPPLRRQVGTGSAAPPPQLRGPSGVVVEPLLVRGSALAGSVTTTSLPTGADELVGAPRRFSATHRSAITLGLCARPAWKLHRRKPGRAPSGATSREHGQPGVPPRVDPSGCRPGGAD